MRTRAEQFLPFALLLPSIAFLGLLILIPMVQALLLAVLAEGGGLTLENFQRMLSDVNFSDAWRNTLLLLFLIVPLQIVLALAMALLINSRFRGHGFFLYIYAIPLAISDLAAGILWLAVFTERGYLNSTLQSAGVIDQPILYLSFENFAGIVSAIVIAEAWRATAIVLLILIAGLQLIPRDFFEAADLFGADRIRRTIHVVLPLLRPSLQSALIIRTIFAFQTFAVVFALAGRNMPVLAGEAYTWYAANRNEHLAATYAVLLLGLTIVATVVYLRVLGLREAEVQR
ncbi:MAG TPA: sugar ABC transporter permease [Candidatus Limnocylindria bacterium]|jgi:multiple sugar transport system permease protein|nr:sugar ABC transporter permease [Candidatus Limnocylindria bacterium]